MANFLEKYTIAELIGDMVIGGATDSELRRAVMFEKGEISREDFHQDLITFAAKYHKKTSKVIALFPKGAFKYEKAKV